jgi:hypothetical protein
MKKKIIALILCSLIILGFPLQAFSVTEINLLSYDMIEKEFMARNPDILDNNKAYGRTVDNVDRNNSWSISITAQGINTEKSNLTNCLECPKSLRRLQWFKAHSLSKSAKEAQLTYQLKLTTLKNSLGRATKEEVVKAENALSDQKRATPLPRIT